MLKDTLLIVIGFSIFIGGIAYFVIPVFSQIEAVLSALPY